jgi:sugar/nucleoside kinase (ribokinase family)
MGAAVKASRLVGVGGIGTGIFFALEGGHDLGRNESRMARRLDVRDYCKLHIAAHYPSVLLGARASGAPFHVLPVGRVGRDAEGERLVREMAAAGMDVRFVQAIPGPPTLMSVCFQYADGSGGNITTSDSAASRLQPSDLDAVAGFVDERTIVLAAAEVPVPARRRLLQLGRERGAFAVAAASSAELRAAEGRELLGIADLVALNQDEAEALAGRPFVPDDASSFFGSLSLSARLVVTAGAAGASGWDGRAHVHVPALRVPVASTAGAGDAVLGGLVTGLAAGLPLFPSSSRTLAERPVESALDLGVCLAAYAVASPHTIPEDLGWARVRSFLAPLGVRFGAALDGLAGVAA